MLSSKSSSTYESMEEVWNDITLSSLHHHRSTSTPTTAQTFPLQDFFSEPTLSYNKDPPPQNDVSSAGDTISLGLGSLPKRPSSSTASLSLGFRFVETSGPICQKPALENNNSTSRIKKRVQQKDDDVTSDLKHKRLMKNRESAARSRARKQEFSLSFFLSFFFFFSLSKKTVVLFYYYYFWLLKLIEIILQVYINELEHEVAHLRKENARLKKQLTQFYLAIHTEDPKKRSLYRTLTA